MESSKECIFRLYWDTEEFDKQISDFLDLVSPLFPDDFPELFIIQLSAVCSDIVFTDCRSTLAADNVTEIVQGYRVGSSLDIFKAAVFAGNWDNHEIQLKS